MTRTHEELRASREPLERAINYTSDYWIPVNPVLCRELEKKIRQGEYQNDLEALLGDLRRDVGLYTHLIRRLAKMLKPGELDPASLLREAGINELSKIILQDAKQISPHSIAQGSDLQFSRFNETLISATTAETLAGQFAVDSDAAYSAAVIRQLGLALIAWNYPGIYEGTIATLDGSLSLEAALALRLGFSPSTLAIRIISSWGFSAEYLDQIGLTDDLESVATPISQICQIGEALARANDPDTYPTARGDWGFAQEAVEKHLGVHGMDLIREKFIENIELYYEIAPEIFGEGALHSPDQYFERFRSDEPRRLNPLLSHCKRPVRRELRRLYRAIAAGEGPQILIRKFTHELIPSTDFQGGAIFTLDPGLMQLVPQLELGELSARKFEPVPYAISASDNDLLSLAFRTSEPATEFKKCAGGSIAAMAAAFGGESKVGVIYLELPVELFTTREEQQRIHLAALVYALNDVLAV